MKRKGCKPKEIALVEHLDGSLQAKERLKVILATIAGRLTIGQACQRLGVGEARFHRLRAEWLQDGLDLLEQRPVGRPRRKTSPDALRCQELERENAEQQAELKLAVMRADLARVLPQLREDPPLKKTTAIPNRKR
jgi:transposase